MRRGLSWRRLEREYRARDAAFRASVSEEYYLMFRYQVMPPQLSGRAARQVRRVGRLVEEARFHRGRRGEAWSRKMLRQAAGALLRIVRDSGGDFCEFHRTVLRPYARGRAARPEFEDRAAWALRLVEGAHREDDP